jgi:ribosomal protein S18 acetylase RimI-like enzyme
VTENARVRVRPARPGEAAAIASLLYEVSPEAHDRFAGGRERALAVITAAFEQRGNSGSAEVTRVAELDSEAAGVICGYPVWEAQQRARAYVSLGLRSAPLWRRPLMLWFLYRMQRATPEPARESLYVDAIATGRSFRRLGIGRALLAAAEQEARDRGLIRIGLETEVTNTPARGLYESCGYVAGPEGARVPGLPRYVRYVRELGALR